MKSYNGSQRVRLSGVDLISPIPSFSSSIGQAGVFVAIPANPAYWTGTRVAGIAAVYQQFRPIKFDVKYTPSVPVTTPGNVVYGTLWSQGVAEGNLQQTLATSVGGGIVSCYTHSWSRVKCNKQTLPQEFFTVSGNPVDQQSNPFWWYAYYTGGGTTVPGYVTVHWTFDFVVGQGAGNRQYMRLDSENETVKEVLRSYPANLTSIFGIPIGILKSVFIPILRKCAILILKGVVASFVQAYSNDTIEEQVEVPPGTVLEYSYADTPSSTGFSYAVSNSLKYQLPDDTECIVIQCGQQVQRTQGPVPPVSEVTLNKIGYVISGASSNITLIDSSETLRYERKTINVVNASAPTYNGQLILTFSHTPSDGSGNFKAISAYQRTGFNCPGQLTFEFSDGTGKTMNFPSDDTQVFEKTFAPPLPEI